MRLDTLAAIRTSSWSRAGSAPIRDELTSRQQAMCPPKECLNNEKRLIATLSVNRAYEGRSIHCVLCGHDGISRHLPTSAPFHSSYGTLGPHFCVFPCTIRLFIVVQYRNTASRLYSAASYHPQIVLQNLPQDGSK